MEHLFSPCTRLYDRFETQSRLEEFRGHGECFQELKLDESIEELLSYTYAILENEESIAWLTPHAAVAREDGEVLDSWETLDEPCRFGFDVDDKVIHIILARSQPALCTL